MDRAAHGKNGELSRLADVGVLLADDDKKIAEIVKDILSVVGFSKIFIARDGTKALEIMRNEQIDLVITDWQMEPMDGITLVEYLRKSPESPNRYIPIIMFTGSVEHKHVEIARDSGITEFVAKPFSARTLFDRIQLVVEHPRSFILTKTFKGPDRRRRKHNAPASGERRKRK